MTAMLALVTEAYGGLSGIAQYNRDFLGALAGGGSLSSITVLPRHAPDPIDAPSGIKQLTCQSGLARYMLWTLGVALNRSIEIVFCGDLYMAAPQVALNCIMAAA